MTAVRCLFGILQACMYCDIDESSSHRSSRVGDLRLVAADCIRGASTSRRIGGTPVFCNYTEHITSLVSLILEKTKSARLCL